MRWRWCAWATAARARDAATLAGVTLLLCKGTAEARLQARSTGEERAAQKG